MKSFKIFLILGISVFLFVACGNQQTPQNQAQPVTNNPSNPGVNQNGNITSNNGQPYYGNGTYNGYNNYVNGYGSGNGSGWGYGGNGYGYGSGYGGNGYGSGYSGGYGGYYDPFYPNAAQ